MKSNHTDISNILIDISEDQFWLKCIDLSRSSSLLLIFIKATDNVLEELQFFLNTLCEYSENETSYYIMYESDDYIKYRQVTKVISLDSSAIYHFYNQNPIDVITLNERNNEFDYSEYANSCRSFCKKIKKNKNKLIHVAHSEINTQNKPCVYVLESESAPNILKIGYTNNFIFKRIGQIKSATGALPDLECMAIYYCDDAELLEKSIHKYFNEGRISSKREFFKGDVSSVTKYVEENSNAKIFLLDENGEYREKNVPSNFKVDDSLSPAMSMVIFSDAVASLESFKIDGLPEAITEKYFLCNGNLENCSIEHNFIESIKRFSHSIIMAYSTYTLNEQGEPIAHDHFRSMKDKIEYSDLDAFTDLSNNIDNIFDFAVKFGRNKLFETSVDIPNNYRHIYSENVIDKIDEFYILSNNLNYNSSILYYSERHFSFFKDHMNL